MRIKVKQVSPPVKEKSYYYFVMEYTQDGKDQKPRKFMSFAEEAYKALKDAQAGDNYDVTLKKDDNGYWQWLDITKVSADAPVTAGSGGTGKAGGWETPEERAFKQQSITRAVALDKAITVLGMGEQNADNITELAAKFEKWLNRVGVAELKDDIPY